MTGAIIRPRFSSPYLLLLFLTLCLSSTFLPHKYKHLIPRTCPSNFHFPLSTTNTAKRFILWRDTFLLLRTESHSTFTSSSFPATVAAASFKWQRRRTDGRKEGRLVRWVMWFKDTLAPYHLTSISLSNHPLIRLSPPSTHDYLFHSFEHFLSAYPRVTITKE